ncbi:ribosomal RNA binding protein involved in 50S recycling; heat shock protein [Candidatus Hydrogenisulfobacillus filiaventi]|uniref:RQC P-site tRNA stabilizing factor n=1 Tax=Candidatus Hydrogenisulfobacillus filiaventi TaxID=2707344 RepID=A0A6F8ZJY7_9FIRM|nr:RNA-binding S4 domain-containing protein [Bacillota bacterium]CAB1130108.1 ribosomal RNA binding protein involved in 50S recycling; heat shock protein [Candidatus Hydrogenisulfobacillus filiaventi]
MRLDKYLKVSRLVKRRTVAKELCDAGQVWVNGHLAKAATEVEVGDRIELHTPRGPVTVEVTAVREHVPAVEADSLYRRL